MKTQTARSLHDLLDIVIDRFAPDPMEQVDSIRDEVTGVYDQLDGWGNNDNVSDAASKAIVDLRKRIQGVESGTDVAVPVGVLEDYLEALDHIQGDVTDVLGTLYQTKQNLDEVLADYDSEAAR